MQLQVTDKYIDTAPISRLITQGENGVDVIIIPLPKMRGEVDLSELTYTMRGVSEKETLAAQVLEKTLHGETVRLKWYVTSDFTAVAGGLTLSITGVNASGEKIIHYTAAAINIRKTPTKEFTIPKLDVFEQLLTQAQAALQAATMQAEQAKAEADRLTEFGISFKVLGFYPTLEQLQAAVPSPAQGDAYGVGTSAIYVYLWNNSEWQRGQALKLDLTEYYTKTAVDERLTALTTGLALKAPLASPDFTGIATLGGKEIPTIEMGKWVPTLRGVTTAGMPIYSAKGTYCKIGNVVFASADITVTSTGGMEGDSTVIGALPYSVKNKLASGVNYSNIAPNSTDYSSSTNIALTNIYVFANMKNGTTFDAFAIYERG